MLQFLFPACGLAQSAASGSSTPPPKPTKEQEDKPGLSVMVRTSNGTAVDTLAVVTLYDSSGQAITSKTTSDSRASFIPLSNGAYIVDVDAPGYAKSRLEAKITTEDGEQLLIVTLKPDTGGGITYAVSSKAVLPPNRRKK